MREDRLQQTIEELKCHDVAIKHIPGVDGRTHRNDKRLTRFGRNFSTDRIIGCALAHNDVAKQILQDGVEYGLVLEDDVIVITDDLVARVKQVVASQKASWDIISLFCQGICSDSTRIWHGSTAAYLMSASGAKKMTGMRIGYHADMIRNSLLFNTSLGPQLFTTRDDRSFIPFGNQSFGFWAKQDFIKVGPVTLTVLQFLIVLATAIALAKRSGNSGAISGLVMFLPILTHFMHYETQHFRCSPLVHALGLALPLAVLMPQENPTVKSATHAMAHGMFLVHLFHELDR